MKFDKSARCVRVGEDVSKDNGNPILMNTHEPAHMSCIHCACTELVSLSELWTLSPDGDADTH